MDATSNYKPPPDDSKFLDVAGAFDFESGKDVPLPADEVLDTTDEAEESTDRLTGPIVASAPETEFRCPGETHSIPRSVHLSRLAAFYPACRQCQHRHDTGQLAPETVERIQLAEQRLPQKSLFQQDGVRGIFLNELTPAKAGQVAAAFASLLWQDVPLTGRTPRDRSNRTSQPTRRGPSVAVGYDERPSSPAILSSVIDSLRMMGCPVIDTGLVSKPCFAFAVDHLQVAGGVFVSGSGHEASWTGLDLFREGAIPLSLGTGLEAVEQRLESGVTRPTRSAAFQRAFQSLVPYEAGLWKHFHALRPLRVVVSARPRPVRRTLRTLFAKLPCEMFEVEATADVNSPLRHEFLMKRISQRVRKRNAHLGLLIDDDGSRCWFLDERGREVNSTAVTELIARLTWTEHPSAPIVAESSAWARLREAMPSSEIVDGGSSAGSVSQAIRQSHASFAGGDSHRYWFREAFPSCDAILTLAHVLQGLSRSDMAFSVAVGRR